MAGAEGEEVLDAGRQQRPPGALGVAPQDVVDDEGQSPLAEVCPHLRAQGEGRELGLTKCVCVCVLTVTE